MYIFLIVLHILVSIVLVGVVLLQSGKGAEMGAAFGGSSQTLFGGRGAATFLSKMTVGAAVLFMVTSLSLSVLSKERSIASSIMDSTRKSEEASPKPAGMPGGPDTAPAAPTASPGPTETPSTAPAPSAEKPANVPSGSGQK